MRKSFLLAAAAAMVLSTPGFAATSCIRQNQIDNWSALNDHTIVLEDIGHQKALLKLIGTCGNFNFSEAIEVRTHGVTGLSCVSPGDMIVTHAGIPGRCAVVAVTPYDGPMHPKAHGGDDHHDDGDHHGSY